MKILIATAVYYPQINGVAVFSHNLAVGLARRGHQVAVICPSQTGKSYTKVQDGVEVHYLHSVDVKVYPDQIHPVPEPKQLGRVKLPRLIYRHGLHASIFPRSAVRHILDQFQPDVVHIQVSDPIGLSVVKQARQRGIPVVTTEHNQPEVLTDSLSLPRFVKRPANALLSAYFRNRQNKSDFVTMPTKQAIHRLLGKKGGSEGLVRSDGSTIPVAAVSNGVDLSHFRPGPASAEIYTKYHLPKDRPIVLYVGRIDPEKQVGKIIEAFNLARPELAKTEVNPFLLIVGDGVDRARLEQLVASNQNFKFLGKVLPPDLYALYQTGTVFATASEIETQGIVLIEAAACGLPLIAVSQGAVSEICLDGQNGILCSAGDVSAISAALIKILSDSKLQQQYSRASLRLAAQHDLERTLNQFEHIYHHVTTNHKHSK